MQEGNQEDKKVVSPVKWRKTYQVYQIPFNPSHAEYINMARPLPIFSQSDYLIQIVDINSNTEWQTVQVQISRPNDLDLHCLQK